MKTPRQGSGRDLADYLEDMAYWSSVASEFVANETEDEYAASLKSQLAVTKALENVGEAAGRVLSHYPDWAEPRRQDGLIAAYNLRNRIAHGYEDTDYILLRNIVLVNLPRLVTKIESWLSELSNARA